MSRKDSRFTSDFGPAARNVDDEFEPNELTNPVPWPFIAIAVALAVWGAVTLYLDAQADRRGEDAQMLRNDVQEGNASAAVTPAEIEEADGNVAAAKGAVLFGTYCATCHQANGSGVRGAIPPLDGSRYVLADAEVPAGILLRGIAGPIEVTERMYNGRMPTFQGVLNDQEIALILSHVRTSWSNAADPVTAGQVAKVRQRLANELNRPWADGYELQKAFGIEASPAPGAKNSTAPGQDDSQENKK